MAREELGGYLPTEKRRNLWMYIALYLLIGTQVVIMGLYYSKCISGEVYMMWGAVFLAGLAALLILILTIRGRKVVRGNETCR